jgi:hypothetical protein
MARTTRFIAQVFGFPLAVSRFLTGFSITRLAAC